MAKSNTAPADRDAQPAKPTDPRPKGTRPVGTRAKTVVLAVVVALLAVGGFLGLKDRHRSPAPAAPGAKASGTMTLGRDDAPIVVVEYSDFQCPYCGVFARDIQPTLIEQFVEPGVVRFEWRNFPIFGPFSDAAAVGAYCADEHGAFWPYHDALFATVDEWSASERNVDRLVAVAESVGLDGDNFRACIASGKYDARVQADYEEGRALNIIGTPSFTVNGVVMVGAQPVDVWRRVFEVLGE